MDRLVRKGILDPGAYRDTAALSQELGGTDALNLVRAGVLTEDDLLSVIQQEFDVSTVLQFEMEDLPSSILTRIPRRVAEAHRAVPVREERGRLVTVMSDPTDPVAISAVKSSAGQEIEPCSAAESVISWALLKYYEVITPAHTPRFRRSSKQEQKAPDDMEPLLLTAVVEGTERPSDGLAARVAGAGADAAVGVEKEEPPPGGRISFPVIREESLGGEVGPSMGEWDAPFDLKRAVSQPPRPVAVARMPATQQAGKPIDTPHPGGAAEAPTPSDEPILLIDEEDWNATGGELEEVIEAGAVADDRAIITEPSMAPKPIVMTRNVVVGKGGGGGADIIPPQPMTSRKAVSEIKMAFPASSTSGGRVSAPPPGSPSPMPVRRPLKPLERPSSPPVAKPEATRPSVSPPKARAAADVEVSMPHLDLGMVAEWKQQVSGLDTRDDVLEATLSFLDVSIGPVMFLARKGQGLAGWACSLGCRQEIEGDIHDVIMMPPAPREVWHAMERKRGFMGPAAVIDEYAFLRQERIGRHLFMVLPVVVKGIAAGALLCMPRRQMPADPKLRDALEAMGKTLSERLEQIVLRKKHKETVDR